jgi:hypothetical protein
MMISSPIELYYEWSRALVSTLHPKKHAFYMYFYPILLSIRLARRTKDSKRLSRSMYDLSVLLKTYGVSSDTFFLSA